jgi:hypothetical protein
LTIACIVALVGVTASVIAGNSGVSDPTITVNEFTPSGGSSRAAKEHASLDSLDDAVEDVIDVLDAIQFETGSATNDQLVTFTLTYAAAPLVLVETQNATTNSYASSITASNCTINAVAGDTNKYVVIPMQ